MGEDDFFSVPADNKGPSNSTAGAPGMNPSAGGLKQTARSSLNSSATQPGVNSASGIISNSASTSTAASASASTSNESGRTISLEEANEEIAILLQSGKVSQQEVSALQGMMRDHLSLREKINKLKSLLGRSAKAQREAKMELEVTTKKLDATLKENERLQQKVDHLANRPTHMELLADFETNFDRALLSVGQQHVQQHHQTGGETTAPSNASALKTKSSQPQQEQVLDGMLLQELSESQARIDRLENLNAALLQRSSDLERKTRALMEERDALNQQLDNLNLQLRMAQMEAEHATRDVQDKLQSLQEMQLEINLVTKASMDANVRAKQGEEAAKMVRSDRETVQQLQAQVTALQEWALASAEAKRLCQERVRLLESKLSVYEKKEGDGTSQRNTGERLLFSKTSSMVVGAGDVGFNVLELGEYAQQIQQRERVVLRWRFDMTPHDLIVEFSIMKGRIETPQRRLRADYLIKNRVVRGGAGAELEGAFAVQNACTLLWSNEKSWVRPRTIKFVCDVFAVKD